MEFNFDFCMFFKWCIHVCVLVIVIIIIIVIKFECGDFLAMWRHMAAHTTSIITWETCHRAHLSVKVEAGSSQTHDHSHTHPAYPSMVVSA